MYKRFTFLTIIILSAIALLACLGNHAIGKWAQGLEGSRLGDFIEVAEQIQQDVMLKLDNFIKAEQDRPYTDYLYYYVPENINLANAFVSNSAVPYVRSPLVSISNGMAYGYFQVEPDGTLVSPYYIGDSSEPIDDKTAGMAMANYRNIKSNVLPLVKQNLGEPTSNLDNLEAAIASVRKKLDAEQIVKAEELAESESQAKFSKSTTSRAGDFDIDIEGLQPEKQRTKVVEQSRSLVNFNRQENVDFQIRWNEAQNNAFQQPAQAQAQQGQTDTYNRTSESVSTSQRQTAMNIPTDVSSGMNGGMVAGPVDNRSGTGGFGGMGGTMGGGRGSLSNEPHYTDNISVEENKSFLDEQQKEELQESQMPGAPPRIQDSEISEDLLHQRERQQQQQTSDFQDSRYSNTSEQDPNSQLNIIRTRSSRTDQNAQQQMPADQIYQQAAGQQSVEQIAQMIYQQQALQVDADEKVPVHIGPFIPIIAPEQPGTKSVFGGQVFLIRQVQAEDKTLVQGFKLNDEFLLGEVRESASRLMRDGMTFDLGYRSSETNEPEPEKANNIAYTARLRFDFGDLILNLKEVNPFRIAQQTQQLRTIYFAIVAVALFVIMLALGGMWHSIRAQVILAEKKDEFVSSVSHELRTPLTSIRMYAEMLEKNWVKSKDKLAEYYKNMLTESERLSRLVENVLDFSRIQKGKKHYSFSAGNLNDCVTRAAEMMIPYAEQNAFTIKMELADVKQSVFDWDAVTQIVVNLLDNAVKYAQSAADKSITVRTSYNGDYLFVEIEDHGPGIPHRQRKKIFEQFYRLSSEMPTQDEKPQGPKRTGTGLGLALVKRFAEAHNGFVEVISAQPRGVIFRVGLAAMHN